MSSLSTPFLYPLEGLQYLLLRLWSGVWGKDDHRATSPVRVGATALALGLMVLYPLVARYLASPYRKLPPGPRGYPIIGNLRDVKAGQWIKYSNWQKKYGDLIYLNAAGQDVIIINSPKIAVALLDRRATIYSDRPRNYVASDIMAGGLFFGFTRYNDTWRRMRKAANEKLSANSVKGFFETQMKEAVLQASDLLAEPAQWNKHFHRGSASMTLSNVYGFPTLKADDGHIVHAINDLSQRLFYAVHVGAHWVDFFPWMRYLPRSIAKWKRVAETSYREDTAMLSGLLQRVGENVEKGDDHQSVAAQLILEEKKYKLSFGECSWLLGTLYVGGSDTTPSAMAFFVLAMIVYPEIQARAQAELDAVVGRTRLPTFADFPHLPYIRATVKELLRWRPNAPLGTPHSAFEDDWYDGMFIPKGTILIPNVWNMNRDPEIYGDNTEHFDPSRFLDAQGEISPRLLELKKDGHFTYGFGSRICAGRHLADNALFINIATVLWGMKLERKSDASGQLIPLDLEGWVDGGLVIHPVPYEFKVTPRFPEVPAMFAQERELRV